MESKNRKSPGKSKQVPRQPETSCRGRRGGIKAQLGPTGASRSPSDPLPSLLLGVKTGN